MDGKDEWDPLVPTWVLRGLPLCVKPADDPVTLTTCPFWLVSAIPAGCLLGLSVGDLQTGLSIAWSAVCPRGLVNGEEWADVLFLRGLATGDTSTAPPASWFLGLPVGDHCPKSSSCWAWSAVCLGLTLQGTSPAVPALVWPPVLPPMSSRHPIGLSNGGEMGTEEFGFPSIPWKTYNIGWV